MSISHLMLNNISTPLRNYIRRFVTQESDVDDISQDTYIKIMEVPKSDQIENLQGYARKIAKNLIIDKNKQAFSKCEELIDEPVCAKSELDTIMEQQERIRIYQDIIKNMPEIRRHVFISYRLRGESKQEISQRMGLSLDAVNKHITRALNMLKNHITQTLNEQAVG